MRKISLRDKLLHRSNAAFCFLMDCNSSVSRDDAKLAGFEERTTFDIMYRIVP